MSDLKATSSWICSELSRILGIPATEDLSKYLMSMESSRDIEEYLQSMLDITNSDHLKFVEDLIHRLGHSQGSLLVIKNKSETSEKACENNPNQALSHKGKTGKSKNKQISLFSAEGKAREIVTLPGQHWCECQASKHPLIRNCLDCGRVICAQEGSGPCLFCTSQYNENAPQFSKKSRQTEKNKLDRMGTNKPSAAALMSATAHKEKLLEYDRTSEHRTRVIDDESDYFNTEGNRWLTPKQRDSLRAREQELRAKRFGSKREMKVTLDFTGRQVVEETPNFDELFTEQKLVDEDSQRYYDQFVVNPILDFPRPTFEPVDGNDASRAIRRPLTTDASSSNRLQDSELQKMSDQGKCLSMHQPYASLLVAGIKKHEGRSWYSSHRGRLWIASTAKVASDDDIRELENFYRTYYGKDITFPQHYPSGCILGCIEVVDILPQEEYRLQYPHGESESPYVFLCENPLELFIKFPIKGHHKIYKLDPAVHQTAKKSLAFDSSSSPKN